MQAPAGYFAAPAAYLGFPAGYHRASRLFRVYWNPAEDGCQARSLMQFEKSDDRKSCFCICRLPLRPPSGPKEWLPSGHSCRTLPALTVRRRLNQGGHFHPFDFEPGRPHIGGR